MNNPLLSPPKCCCLLCWSWLSWPSHTRSLHHESRRAWQWLKTLIFMCRFIYSNRCHATGHDIKLQIEPSFDHGLCRFLHCLVVFTRALFINAEGTGCVEPVLTYDKWTSGNLIAHNCRDQVCLNILFDDSTFFVKLVGISLIDFELLLLQFFINWVVNCL